MLTWKYRDAVENLTQAILEKTSKNFPVDIDEIINYFKGELKEEELIDYIDAKINKNKEDSFEIILNKPKQYSKKIFYKAHLIGHLFLHMGFIINEKKWENINYFIDSPMRASWDYREEEEQANYFAGALLMPKKEFIEQWNNNDRDIIKMSKLFNVSQDAVIVRRNNLITNCE